MCALSLVVSVAGCAGAPDAKICSPAEPSACEDGKTCVAGRCHLADTPIASADALRYVVAPLDLAVIGSSGCGESGGGADLPSTVALGRGTTVVLMRFEPSWRDDVEVLRAFVVLDPVEGVMPGRELITFETARIREAWDPSIVSWGRQPKLDVPIQAGSLRARPAASLRLDVTPVVRAWVRRGAHGGRGSDDHGIALLARGDDAFGAVVATGASRGTGPRLEVYVK